MVGLVSFAGVLFLALTPAMAQQPEQLPNPRPITITSVAATATPEGLEVEIRGSSPMAAHPFVLSNPDRIAVDLNNAVLLPRGHHISVGHDGVVSVRFSQFQATPPISRIVLDLEAPRQYQLRLVGNSVVLRLVRSASDRAAASKAVRPIPNEARSKSRLGAPAARVPSGVSNPASASRRAAAETMNNVTAQPPSPRSQPSPEQRATGTVLPRPLLPAPASRTAPNPAATPQPTPLTTEQMPPVPPRVSYQNGLLTVEADNCLLGDVLHAIAERTGAQVELPAQLPFERVASKLGPAPPNEVLYELLKGSEYDFIIVQRAQQSGVEKIILTRRIGG
jgi:hypothetical protein